MNRVSVAIAVVGFSIACANPPDQPEEGGRERYDEYFDSMVDRHIEAGYEDPRISESDPLLAQRTIVVTAAINERTAKDVIARLLYLDRRDPKQAIDLVLSTPGGWLDVTFAVIDTFEMIRAPVNVWGVGGVHSAGSLILANASGRRFATRNTIISVHANMDSDEDAYSALKQQRFEAAWRRRTRLPEDWYPMTGDTTHYLSPEQALEYGVIDEIVDRSVLPAKR